jgi:hypothetical protein
LAITAQHQEQLKSHLYPGDGKEAVAIGLCGRSHYEGYSTLLVQELFLIPYASCPVRERDRVTWRPEVLAEVLAKAMRLNLSIVKFHSHPRGLRQFSLTDDQSDVALFESVYGWLDTDSPQASVIILPEGEMFGRAITPHGIGNVLRLIRVVGDDIQYCFNQESIEATPDHAIRLVQTFGEGTYQILRGLRAGVVGCSGTGSILIEQLLRNYIGTLVAVDPEVIENKNLNRILNSTNADAQSARSKVSVVQETAQRIGLGTEAITYEADLQNVAVIQALSQCDVIFGCMDSVDGRHLLNKLATYYLIPYVDMGVRIDADGKGGVDAINGAVHYIKPGGSSLLSRGVYSGVDLEAASIRRHTPEQYADRLEEGYIKGVRVDQPAVISVNMQIASTAFNEFLARIHPYRLEPNRCYAQRRIVISDPSASLDIEESNPCKVFARYLAKGDQKPLLGLLGLAP